MADAMTSINYILPLEGGLVDNPNDPGGLTNMGISMKFMKGLSNDDMNKYPFVDPNDMANCIRCLTQDQAIEIYTGEFWNKARFSDIEDQDICNYIFDMAINMGTHMAIKCSQHAIWECSSDASLIDDGQLGDNTIEAINSCGADLMQHLRNVRISYYRSLVAANSKLSCFLKGWINRANQ